MASQQSLADAFEHHRAHLRAVAYRILGSVAEAEDAVQESWFRLQRADTAGIDNLPGWLTTVVSRICLDMLRSRASRPATSMDQCHVPESADPDLTVDPEHEAILADSVGTALQIVLNQLAPAERVAFVLHDVFAVPFDEIAAIIDRTPEATRQLASRARRRVRGGQAPSAAEEVSRRAELVKAFLTAAREGDLTALIAMLDPDVELHGDATIVAMGAEGRLDGPEAVARRFSGGAQVARPMLLDGEPGLVWMAGKEPRVVFRFTFEDDHVTRVDLIADPDRLATITLAPMPR